METNVEAKQLEQLEEIADDLEALRVRANDPKRSFMTGIFQGAGAVVGGIIALALLGWLLGLLGVIPGFSSFEEKLNAAKSSFEHSR
jgi:hypothetical protein